MSYLHLPSPIARPILIDDNGHIVMIHSSLTDVRCSYNVGKQPVALKEYLADYLLKNSRKTWITAVADVI